MEKPQLIFIELKNPNKRKAVCEITEKLYLKGRRVIIYVKDEGEAEQLDRMLWVWKQESFVPHALSSGEETTEEAVIISTQASTPTEFDTLILYDALPIENIQTFRQIIDFAELYQKERHQASRNRFKAARDSRLFELSFVKPGAFLNRNSQAVGSPA